MLIIGDTIKCTNADDMISVMNELAKENIETDFLYELDGEKGFRLEVIKINK